MKKLSSVLLLLIVASAMSMADVVWEDCNSKAFGYIDASGKFVIPARFVQAYGFHDGIATARTCAGWGYIDKSGKFVIAPQFPSSAGQFSEGLAEVEASQKKWGFINMKGKFVISPQF